MKVQVDAQEAEVLIQAVSDRLQFLADVFPHSWGDDHEIMALQRISKQCGVSLDFDPVSSGGYRLVRTACPVPAPEASTLGAIKVAGNIAER